MTAIDNPFDPRQQDADLYRRVSQLNRATPLNNATITSGPGLEVGTPEGIWVSPGSSIAAGDVKVAVDGEGDGSVKAGVAEFTKDGVGAGGTKIRADGSIHSDANKVVVASNTEFAGNVKAAGTVEGDAIEASGTRIDSDGSIKRTVSGALKVDANTEFAGNVIAAGTAKATNVEATGILYTPWRGGKQAVEELAENIQANALGAAGTANAAKALADNHAPRIASLEGEQGSTGSALSTLTGRVNALVNKVNQVIDNLNALDAYVESQHPTKVSVPPIVKG